MRANANTQMYDKIVDRAAMIRLYERRVNGKVSVILDGHVVRVDKLIREAKLSEKGFLRLREAIDQELTRTYRSTYNVSKRSLLDLVRDQSSYMYQVMDTTMRRIWRTRRAQRRIAEEFVLERPLYSDRTLAQGWAGVSLSEKKRLEKIIRRGMSEGKTADEIAVDVRKGNAHKITRNQSRALVVTAITSVRSQTDHAIYEANGKALVGWQYVAVLDARTTEICSHRDGTIYPIKDRHHLPPAHYNCRSTTIPVFKSWEDVGKLEGVAQVRKRNVAKLTEDQIQFYDGQTPMKESYNTWLMRQPMEVKLRHLGDYKKAELFSTGKFHVKAFTNPEGNSVGIKELRALTDAEYQALGDTKRFSIAKDKLDAMKLWASNPDDFIDDPELARTLKEYYLLQAGQLDGTLSLVNYRGVLIGTKKNTKRRVLAGPPGEEQLFFNPITGLYEDSRLYSPNIAVFNSALRRLDDSEDLKDGDKKFIRDLVDGLTDRMGVNERAVVTENLRVLFTRYRKNPEVWTNFKALAQSQIKFDVMNVSDSIETQLSRDRDVLKRLTLSNFVDPVLGPVQLEELHDKLFKNIRERNRWEDKVAPKIAKELRNVFDYKIPLKINRRMSEEDKQQFYLKFAHRLSLSNMPDRDQLAVELGRDLYNTANINGSRGQWYDLGKKLLEARNVNKFFEIETFGVKKRRMRSRMSGQQFGPYYDALSYNIRITDPRIQRYSKLQRLIDLGMRVGALNEENRLLVRERSKTYWMKTRFGYEDTRIPITSASTFGEFPEDLVDKELVDALNWTGSARYKVDPDFYDFTKKLLYFKDDRGRAEHFDDLNEYRHYIVSRSDSYERFKAMEWLRDNDHAFSHNPFVDHRARIYERGFIGPQSGETFRPFLNTAESLKFSPEGYHNLQDQIGAFLGGIDDYFEGRYNGLSVTGRQKIAEKWRDELVKIGNHMLRGKPNDVRAVLENPVLARIDGEEQGKLLRFAMEQAKLDRYLRSKGVKDPYSEENLSSLLDYDISLALEQDASSSGAQIIALTTRNKELAELSNVIPTSQKKRLYDEIAFATFNDPRFRELNLKLGLTEKDLRKASKAQNMVTFYGAGTRTGILNVERKLAKILDKEEEVLVITAKERDAVLSEISARMARYQRFDPDTYDELKTLRANVKDIFDKGLKPGAQIMEELYFLDSATRDFVDKMSSSYQKVVTPEDFKLIAKIMSEHLAEQAPILRDFTRYFGRLAEEYLINAKPSKSDFDWKTIGKIEFLGPEKKGADAPYKLPRKVSQFLGLKANEPVSEKVLKRFGFWKKDGTLWNLLYGVSSPEDRRTGAKYFKTELLGLSDKTEIKLKPIVKGVEFFTANKLPKSWTNVPWVNFDGKVVENNFTQTFEQRLAYKDAEGNWVNNIIQVPQRTSATWWEELVNKSGKINDIADVTKARTAFAVNGNHSNDATFVKQFHLWGRANNVPTSTVHDAFFGNTQEMLKARKALRNIFAKSLDRNVIKETLDEMRRRGLPYQIYKKYLDEAKDLGLIPIVGRSKIGGRVVEESDILKKEDILREIPEGFSDDFSWYGVG